MTKVVLLKDMVPIYVCGFCFHKSFFCICNIFKIFSRIEITFSIDSFITIFLLEFLVKISDQTRNLFVNSVLMF
jgi:hypothetical protein